MSDVEIQLGRSRGGSRPLLWILVSIAMLLALTFASTRGCVPIDHNPRVIPPAPQADP